MTANYHTAELHQALGAGVSYAELCFALQQRMSVAEYQEQAVLFGAMRYWSYRRLPNFVREDVSEEKYYVSMVQHLKARLQLFPYPHVEAVVRYTHETPLVYYTVMIAELLKKERSYDTLPNFTAVDVLNCIGIGRNEYLELTREVRSKVRWHVNRGFVKDHLPARLLSTMELTPFCRVLPVDGSAEPRKKSELTKGELLMHNHLLQCYKGQDSKDSSGETIVKNPENIRFKNGGSGGPEVKKVEGDFGRMGSQCGAVSAASASSPRTPLGVPPSAHSSASVAADGTPIVPSPKSADDAADIAHRCCYACELSRVELLGLYHKGLVCTILDVSIEDQIVVPPLEHFVMNRTSDDPIEVLLYKVLGTIDDRTSLRQLAKLLVLEEEDLCLAVQMCIRLRLAQPRTNRIPKDFEPFVERVHTSWSELVQPFLTEESSSPVAETESTDGFGVIVGDDINSGALADSLVESSWQPSIDTEGLDIAVHFDGDCIKNSSNEVNVQSIISNACGAEGQPAKRLVLLYDTSLLGFLMMTNLSTDPSFRQHVVTLFEMGKLSDETMGGFIEKLEQVQGARAECGLFGEAAQYVQNVLSLREVVKKLRQVVGPEGEQGLDMLKVESVNEQDPTTRYSLLARNYWAYFVASPVAQAPLIDVSIKGVYGSSVSLMPSPWMMLFLYEKVHMGPPSVLLPVGLPLFAWPPALQDSRKRCVAKLRLQPFMVNAEVTYAEVATSLILANEMTATAPLFVQRVVDVPLEIPAPSAMAAAAAEAAYEDGGLEGDVTCAMNGVVVESPFHMLLTVLVPFTASDDEAVELLCKAVQHKKPSVAALRFISNQTRNTTTFTLQVNDTNNTIISEEGVSSDGGCDTPTADVEESDKVVTPRASASVMEETHPMMYVECFRSAVEALQLQDSLGHFNFHVSLYEVGNTSTDSGNAYLFRVDAAHIVDMGLGIALADQPCCELMVKHLEGLLSESRMEAHSKAMLQLSREMGNFLERHSTLTTTEREHMALQSAAIAGPLTQQHVRRLGEKGNSGAPFPNCVLLFDGERLSAIDDWDPLVELWQV
ncbi:hypothetical protein, conserved [Trypanosoma brucei gambiense DAL972]|uniref:FAM91 N-terminal domain-containing protein n=1 Tax=Trypanosoma brucei gambiense (strain MHOM/CI/86/DAL972) TaxID=679716 RepID=C9ZI44_TRYB9|nr:hypothetical protein, conserved [Trypanosoma brucei gambiense DAL972]CBH09161.1 hypothetical protein, conserved [Trypanosoma brucei gambiense DAL972]|eukprot:XP_011771602.1 hypothetical protein, conserved [Trypanosoma brucei gambiense DAL972]